MPCVSCGGRIVPFGLSRLMTVNGTASACCCCSGVMRFISTMPCSTLWRRNSASLTWLRVGAVGGARRSDQSREVRRLGQGDLRQVVPEVRADRGADAVRATAEVHHVEIALEDLLLRELLLDLDRQDRLFELAGQRPLARQIHRLHVLLGDRGPALRRPLAPDIRPEGAQRADRIDGGVIEEVPILRREDGVDHHRRHLVERDVLSVLLAVQARDGVVGRAVGRHVGGADERGLRLDPLGR